LLFTREGFGLRMGFLFFAGTGVSISSETQGDSKYVIHVLTVN
jgi:hypothetical protein